MTKVLKSVGLFNYKLPEEIKGTVHILRDGKLFDNYGAHSPIISRISKKEKQTVKLREKKKVSS